MEDKIRILYLEDAPAEAEQALIQISMNGIRYSHSVVESKEDYIDSLVSFMPDLILADYKLPKFDGINALDLRNEITPHTPFIFVTDPLSEELAVECMKAGADDYILKTNISRLGPAIKSAFNRRNISPFHYQSERSVARAENQSGSDLRGKASDSGSGSSSDSVGNREDYHLIEEKLTILDMAMESAGIGTWVLDIAGRKRYFDSKASQLLGFAHENYKKSEEEFYEVVHPDDRVKFQLQIPGTTGQKNDFETEFRAIHPDGNIRYLTARAKTITDNEGKSIRLIGLLWDITEYKTLQIKLQESIRRTNSIINNLNGAVYRCKLDEERTMEFISEGIYELTGCPSEDFLNNKIRSFASLISPEDRQRVWNCIVDAMGEMNTFTAEYRIIDAKNETKWIWERGRGVFINGKVIAVEGFFTDITDRKKTEVELQGALEQQHQLTQYVETVRENERVAISRELHDDLGQALTAVKIDISTIRQLTHEKEVDAKLKKVSDLVSDTIRTVQRLTSQLRPQIIDDLGLVSAMEWYAREFEERSKIEITLDLNFELNISPETSLIIFRVMQEALTNVARHSTATKVNIKLANAGDELFFKMSDNGSGITESEINSKKSFGIISMKERAASRGGTFEISGKKGGGTVIRLLFPLTYNRES